HCVTKFCKPLSALLGVVAKPERFRHHQDSRALAGLPVVVRKIADEFHATVLVFHRLCLHSIAPMLRGFAAIFSLPASIRRAGRPGCSKPTTPDCTGRW